MVEKALFESDINGPLSDLLCFFLSAIFSCIEEEEVEEEEMESESKKADLIDDTTEPGELTYKELLSSANAASQTPYLNHGVFFRPFVSCCNVVDVPLVQDNTWELCFRQTISDSISANVS